MPLSAIITGANVHDKWMVAQTLDAVALRAARGPRRPIHLCLDKGYDYRDAEACVRGKARRWVVERTNSWHNRFRALLVRWERKAEQYLAMLHLACGLIAFRQARPERA